jgi:hypothetical protein
LAIWRETLGWFLRQAVQLQQAGAADSVEADRQKEIHDFVGDKQAAHHPDGHRLNDFSTFGLLCYTIILISVTSSPDIWDPGEFENQSC